MVSRTREKLIAPDQSTVWQQARSQRVKIVVVALAQMLSLLSKDLARFSSTNNGCPCCPSKAPLAKSIQLLGHRFGCAAVTQCGLTLRSSGAPTACRQAPLAQTLDSTKYVIAAQCIFKSRDTFAKLVPPRQRHEMRRFKPKDCSVNLLLVGLQRRTRFNCGSVSHIRSIG